MPNNLHLNDSANWDGFERYIGSLRDYTMGDEVLFERLIDTLLRTIPENSAKLMLALTINDYGQIRAVLHTLQPMFIMLEDETSLALIEHIRNHGDTPWGGVEKYCNELGERLTGILEEAKKVKP